ncbi:Putative auto-transporter adhesin, head GIN domain [Cnuella takakiae]|uniref:Putative auto-transporter adhesin, head GIN domain n=1 Tax=Cnuella takakiae TaxID=1302690 RepID=A0A1M5IG36_9BACT|nr:head GIN domain-containing protein [Cnuella takakiae]OLY90831.1 hypothetical protein BUE76_02140 [Cnuella takakiae]SHG27019.1 Putative auto-transporter adhesin, head GIN domain [Cnuella takakiae]
MKSILAFTLVLFTVVANAQTLSGKRVSRDIPVSSFSALKAGGVVELKLVQSDKESVTVDADEALQGYVHIVNNGNTLEIDTRKLNNKHIKGNWKLYVTVHFRQLSKLSINTVGHVQNEGTLKFDNIKVDVSSVGNVDLKMDAQQLDLTSSSVGNIELAGSAAKATMRNSSVGNVRAEELKVKTMEVNNSGIGNMEINAENITSFQGSMLGKVRNRGQKVK